MTTLCIEFTVTGGFQGVPSRGWLPPGDGAQAGRAGRMKQSPLGITEGAIGELVSRAHRRMTNAGAVPFGRRITHYVVWDRWVREQGRADASS